MRDTERVAERQEESLVMSGLQMAGCGQGESVTWAITQLARTVLSVSTYQSFSQAHASCNHLLIGLASFARGLRNLLK